METIRTIKGFDNELKCRGFQYEVGKTYTAEGKIKVCSNGFHALRNDVNPLSVLEYYAPVICGKPSRYCIVDCSGKIDYEDNKLCCSIITIVEEITLDKLHVLSQSWVESHSDEVNSGGDGSSLRGGNESKFCAGKWSSFFIEIRDNHGNITDIGTAIVDGVYVKENQWYAFNAEVGEWKECDAPDNVID